MPRPGTAQLHDTALCGTLSSSVSRLSSDRLGTHAPVRLTGAGLGLVIGGALGNIVDRVRYQAVTDFLDFHLGAYHWPAFNLADVAVVCGTLLLLADGLRKDTRKQAGGGPDPAGSQGSEA